MCESTAPYRALPDIYRNLGTDFNERVLPSIIHETLKSVAGAVYTLNPARDPFLTVVQSFELELLFCALRFASLPGVA